MGVRGKVERGFGGRRNGNAWAEPRQVPRQCMRRMGHPSCGVWGKLRQRQRSSATMPLRDELHNGEPSEGRLFGFAERLSL